jgi:hypothetical protein
MNLLLQNSQTGSIQELLKRNEIKNVLKEMLLFKFMKDTQMDKILGAFRQVA